MSKEWKIVRHVWKAVSSVVSLHWVQILIIIIMLLICLTFWLSVYRKKWFKDHIPQLRGLWYLLSVISIGLYLCTKGIVFSQWKNFIIIVSVFIYIDLILFIRPKIKKIWGAEFDIEDFIKQGDELEKQIKILDEKSNMLGDFVGRIDGDTFRSLQWHGIDAYVISLEGFLSDFANKCFQEVSVLAYSDQTRFRSQAGMLGFNITDETMAKLEAETIVQTDEDTCYIPSRVRDPIVVIVKRTDGVLQSIDFSNIQTLITIHSFFEV